MPYTGPGDVNLPENVQKLELPLRKQWVEVFNSAHSACTKKLPADASDEQKQACETQAFRMANGVAKKRLKEFTASFDEVPGEPLADEKCGSCTEAAMPSPAYGGAKSFADIDTWLTTQHQTAKITEQTGLFRTIVNNIMDDEDLTTDQKSAQIAKAAAELPQRVSNPPEIKEAKLFAATEDGAVEEVEGEKAPTKTEAGVEGFTASDYAYVPDAAAPSTWKLPLAEAPGKLTVAQVARAITALQPGGFRGQKVEIPPADKAGVISKISAAIGKISEADDAQKKNLHDRLSAVKEFEGDEKAGRRLQGGWREKIKGLAAALKDFLSWAEYQDGEVGQDEKKELEEPEDDAKLFAGEHFTILWDAKAQAPRWVFTSTTAFEDKEKEIFATKALEEAVEYCDAHGERGPLLFYHIPGAKVGTCDYQAVIGRFLVESGTFDQTEMGKKMLEHLIAHPNEEFGVSIGYKYIREDRSDGVYDWLRITERSITPPDAQANPWARFSAKEAIMSLTEKKKEALTEIFGEDMAARIVSQAESQSKALEEEGVAFKEAGGEASDGAGAAEGSATEETPEAAESAEATAETPAEGAEAEGAEGKEKAPASSPEVVALKADVAEVKATLATLLTTVKELAQGRKSLDEEIADILSPRRTVGSTAESADDTVDSSDSTVKTVKKAHSSGNTDKPIDPYVGDLVRIAGGSPVVPTS